MAYRVGQKLLWDSAHLRARNCRAADGYILHRCRKGWRLEFQFRGDKWIEVHGTDEGGILGLGLRDGGRAGGGGGLGPNGSS